MNELPYVNKEVTLLVEQLYDALNRQYGEKAKHMKIDILMNDKPLDIPKSNRNDQVELDNNVFILINKLCRISFDKWNNGVTDFHGKKVHICHHQGNFWFEIDGVKFFDKKDKDGYNKTNKYCYALHEYTLESKTTGDNEKKKEVLNQVLNWTS